MFRLPETRWAQSTEMNLASKTEPKTELLTNDDSTIDITNPEPRESVFQESEEKDESLITKERVSDSLLNSTETRGSARLDGGSGAILGDIMKPTKPTNTKPKSKMSATEKADEEAEMEFVD